MSLPLATLLLSLLCHGEVVRLRLVCQPLIFRNLPFYSMRWKVLLFVLKKLRCSSQGWNGDCQRAQITRQFYLFAASPWRKERACLARRDQWKEDNLRLEPQDGFLCFRDFAVLKKKKKENKDAEAGPYCFLQTKPRYLFKNNTDINKHPNIHIPQSQSHGQSAREQSHAPPQLLLLEFQFSHVPHPTGEKSHLIL